MGKYEHNFYYYLLPFPSPFTVTIFLEPTIKSKIKVYQHLTKQNILKIKHFPSLFNISTLAKNILEIAPNSYIVKV